MKEFEDLAHLLIYFKNTKSTQEKIRTKLAEDLLLSKITGSDYLKNRTVFKGGVLLYYLTAGARGYTQDIDFDIQELVVKPETIGQFIAYLNKSSVYPNISVRLLSYKKLNLLAYRGLRLELELYDDTASLPLTADVGHYDGRWFSPQKREIQLTFSPYPVAIGSEANEMMIDEKLATFALHGIDNLRYKDFFDAYWLIRYTSHDNAKVASVLKALGVYRTGRFKSFQAMRHYLLQVFSDKFYLQKIDHDGKNWVNVPISTIAFGLSQYVSSLPEK